MARSPIRYELAAVEELQQAVDWYRQRDERVAQRLIQIVRKKLSEIRARPRSWAADSFGARRVRVGQFPYVIVFVIHRRTVVFIAFAHTSRDPGYWHSRLQGR